MDNDEPLSTEAGRVVQLTLDGQKLSLRLGRRRSAEQELPSGLAIPVPIVYSALLVYMNLCPLLGATVCFCAHQKEGCFNREGGLVLPRDGYQYVGRRR